MPNSDNLRAGVVGVGCMGTHHARVYNELPGIDLVGVADADDDQARSTAGTYGTRAMPTEELLDRVDVASVAVPTRYHHDVASAALERETSVLVEKPFVSTLEEGHDLVRLAHEQDLTLQVGHIERFNPAIDALGDILPDLDIIGVSARRLGPQVDRDSQDDIVMDLMVHDIDLVLSVVDCELETIAAMSTAKQNHVTAQLEFEGGVIGTLKASRVTQKKIRDLTLTAKDRLVEIDYVDQSVDIHRHSDPEYEKDDGGVLHRHENLVARPSVDSGEPLKRELRSFVECVRNDEEPNVTGADGLRAIATANEIRDVANSPVHGRTEVNTSEVSPV